MYGHLEPNQALQEGTKIPANSKMVLGQLNDYRTNNNKNDSHLHLGVTNWSEWNDEVNSNSDTDMPIKYRNPLLYFDPSVTFQIDNTPIKVNDLFKDQSYATDDATSLKFYTTTRGGELIDKGY